MKWMALWPLALNVAAGVWLMTAPYVLGYGGAIGDAHHIAGPTIATFATVAFSDVLRSLHRVNALFGVIVVATAALPEYDAAAIAGSVITGAVVLAASSIRVPGEGRYAGGWRALWRGRLTTLDSSVN